MERHPIEEGEGQKLYRKRIETIRRAEAAIEDGRKEEPSQNARTHGFTAKTFRLAPGEREEDYQVRISDSLKRHQPQDSEELDQVVIIVNATWQLLRIQCAASDLMCFNYEEGTTASDALLLNKGTDFNSLSRYEGTQNRTLDKARNRLKELKQERSGIGILPMRPMGILPMEEDSERGVGVSPAREEGAEPESPRANEPQQQITKRNQEKTQPSRPTASEPQSPRAQVPQHKITKQTQDKPGDSRRDPHANNQHPQLKKLMLRVAEITESNTEFAPEMRELCGRARTFLAAHSWCRAVGEVYLAWGFPKLALCLAYASSREEARWVWVVVGDLSPAQLDTGYCPDAEEALKGYVGEAMAWVEATKEGEPSEDWTATLRLDTHHVRSFSLRERSNSSGLW